jgi:hypothetical protein
VISGVYIVSSRSDGNFGNFGNFGRLLKAQEIDTRVIEASVDY